MAHFLSQYNRGDNISTDLKPSLCGSNELRRLLAQSKRNITQVSPLTMCPYDGSRGFHYMQVSYLSILYCLGFFPPIFLVIKKYCDEHTYFFADVRVKFPEVQSDTPRMVLNISRAFKTYLASRPSESWHQFTPPQTVYESPSTQNPQQPWMVSPFPSQMPL